MNEQTTGTVPDERSSDERGLQLTSIPTADIGATSVLTFDTEQSKAIALCVNVSLVNRIVAITGAAGTGKTTIIREAARTLVTNGHRVALCAPTGKAARRIKDATGFNAVTIHRLLEFPKPYEYDEATGKPLDPGLPKRNKDNPLNIDVVLCDEYAMVNHELNRQLLDALPSAGCIRCFGDNNQLAPIEQRQYQQDKLQQSAFQNYLKDFPSVTLTSVYRQEEGSGILSSAGRIIKGFVPVPSTDFQIRLTDKPAQVIEDMVYKNRDKFSSSKAQIISTQNKGWIGTYELNQRIQSVLNPTPDTSFDPPRHKWQADKQITLGLGDKIVCTENLYDLRDYYERFGEYKPNGRPVQSTFIQPPEEYTILNGETGRITNIQKDHSRLIDRVHIDLGDRIVQIPYMMHEYSPKNNSVYPVFPLKSIDLGYVLTTHKCQGSEYEEIIYMLNSSTKFMQSRRNFYTAVTRARKRVTLITDRTSLGYSVWRKS